MAKMINEWGDMNFIVNAYRDMLGWWRDAKLRPDVSRTFHLEDAGAALGMLSERRSMGKIAVVT